MHSIATICCICNSGNKMWRKDCAMCQKMQRYVDIQGKSDYTLCNDMWQGGEEKLRDYLVQLRAEKGLSQRDVADKLGITRQYYQMIETGERQKHLDLSLAGGLAVLLGVTILDIEHYEAQIHSTT